MIIEVSHPIISHNYGEKFLEYADYMVEILIFKY